MFSALVSLSLLALTAATVAPATWTLRYIDLHISLEPARKFVAGVSHLTFTASGSSPAPLLVDAADSLTVDSAVVVGPGELRTVGLREHGLVRFPIAGNVRAGVSYRASIWYHGQPVRRAVGFGDRGGVPRGASFGTPLSAREWWPSADSPDQKADSADIWISAPSALIAASNGRLIDRTVSSDGKTATAHWSVRHPIYSDVVSFSLADFTVARSTVALTNGRALPLEFYVFPEDSAKAAVTFGAVPRILGFLEERLGAYPFANEKYALAEFARPSFREGQTITNLGPPFITGRPDMDQVIAHEVSHQWFGNSLSVRNWSDIWLNESLSEFMAWEWIHRSQGDSAYQALFDQARATAFPAPISPANPADFSSLFGNGTFVKGPVVVSMLRDLLGERLFAQALQEYVAGHAYGSVSTIDFQRACERAWGKPLDWFFNQWVLGTGQPTLTLAWERDGASGIAVRINQVQAGEPFRLAVPLRIALADGSVVTRSAWVQGRDERVKVTVGGDVKGVTIDARRQLIATQP